MKCSVAFFLKKKRFWLFIALLVSPFVLVMTHLCFHYYELKQAENLLDDLALKARSSMEKRAQKRAFLERFSQFDPNFIQNQLETLSFLNQERYILKTLSAHPATKDRDVLTERFNALTQNNRLVFKEELLRSTKRIKETEQKLAHPVEIDAKDLNYLLAYIENFSIDDIVPPERSPQLLIRDFILFKKDPSTYKLSLSLLKREFENEN